MLKPDGSLDLAPGFSGNVDVTGYSMKTDASGAPVFPRSFAQQATGDEQWRPGFGVPGITAMTVAANGDVYVGGDFTEIGDVEANSIARWDTRAGTWATLGSVLRWYNDQYTYGYALGIAPDAVYVGGVFTSAGEQASVGLAQWTPEQPNPTATGTVVVPGGATPEPTATTRPVDDFQVYLPLTIR